MTNVRTFSIGIIDTSSVHYIGKSLETAFLPPAQYAIIAIAQELAKINFRVTVLNNTLDSVTQRMVEYKNIISLAEKDHEFDIVIAVDNALVFDPTANNIFHQLQRPDQLKILWSHRADCEGSEKLEYLVVNNFINQIFTVSDSHTNCLINGLDHTKRMYEVLKSRVFETRYAVDNNLDLDPMLFVFPGTYKNKIPGRYLYNFRDHLTLDFLLTKIWPKINSNISDSSLVVNVDLSDKNFNRIYQEHQTNKSIIFLNDPNYETKLKEYSLAVATLYPASEWQIDYINALESVLVNSPVISFKSMCLDEVIGTGGGYIVENLPYDNVELLEQKFVDRVIQVHRDQYLNQQVSYSCNQLKDIMSWDTIALQWKQHFYHTFGNELDKSEFDRVQWINYRSNFLLKRKTGNTNDFLISERPIKIESIPQNIVSIAIVDLPGASYDGSTLKKRGLGGSESAVISISRELVKIGFSVTVFNACNEDDCNPGVYDGVTYIPVNEFANQPETYDIIIALRTPELFADYRQHNFNFSNARSLRLGHHTSIRNAKLKVLWMHDTFSNGDEIVESMVQNQQINEVWVLSDFHRNYFLNCNHGNKRNYSQLSKSVWTTRNGINKYIDQIDISHKNPNLFVFNANQSKGLSNLLNHIWPKVQEAIPEAKLVVVGGYYQLGTIFSHHNEESEFEKIVAPHRSNPTITFTGIVNQATVARIMHKCSYFIYPCALPETFGISSWESMSVGTPLITCRFGALEETVPDQFNWKIDYPITPNALFPDINSTSQIDKFVNTVIHAYQNKNYLDHCRQFYQQLEKIAGWDTVALEWKQHVYNKLDMRLSPSEAIVANYSINLYRQLTGRRSISIENILCPKLENERHISVIVPFRNPGELVVKCIQSIAAQRYTNYHCYLIDDYSTDDSVTIIENYLSKLPMDIRDKFSFTKNKINKGALRNQVEVIRNCDDNDIIMLVDGDDRLVNRVDIFDFYNYIYSQGTELTYGSIRSSADNIDLIAQEYTPSIRKEKTYRENQFQWIMPYTHLRTFCKSLINSYSDDEFTDSDGNWFKAGGDVALFYATIEAANPNKIMPVTDIVYHYNDNLANNDFRSNSNEQKKNSYEISQLLHRKKNLKKILIAVPTAKYIEPTTFKSIYEQHIPKGYTTQFQFFYGYNVDQVRNLIAHWTARGFDYLWAVDSDISFPPDTLEKLLSHRKDIVSGVYRQRIPGEKIIELYQSNFRGGVENIPWKNIEGKGLIEVEACGFGCVLINSEVIRAIPYPQFEYHSAIDHENTVSEDIDFCRKAKSKGFKIYADTSVLCDHYGNIIFGMTQ